MPNEKSELIQETKDFIAALGYEKKDIKWIGGQDFVVPTDTFWNAPPQYYNPGFGTQEVAPDLVVVFNDNSWIQRREYDGSEWWHYHNCPKMPLRTENVNNFIAKNYEYSLAEINGLT